MWPRDPDRYDPSRTFRERVRSLEGALTGDEVRDTIRFGELYPSAQSTACFVRPVRGVAVYIIVAADLRDGTELKVRPSRDEYPELGPDDYAYTAITLWPYV